MWKLFMMGLLLGVLFVGPGCTPRHVVTAAGEDIEVDGRLMDREDGTCQNLANGLIWQQGQSKRLHSIKEARDYVAQLRLGGYDDWRLPTVAELYDLHLFFDIHENGNCQIKTEGNYWSDEADSEGRVGAWEMDDNCDPERQYIPKMSGFVRAVRGKVAQ